MKPGYLSTEFWLVVIVGVLTNLGTINVPEKYTWVVNLALVVGYAIARGLAKYESPTFPVFGGSLPPDPGDLAAAEEAEQAKIASAAKRRRS